MFDVVCVNQPGRKVVYHMKDKEQALSVMSYHARRWNEVTCIERRGDRSVLVSLWNAGCHIITHDNEFPETIDNRGLI